jgi:hypothetical protein
MVKCGADLASRLWSAYTSPDIRERSSGERVGVFQRLQECADHRHWAVTQLKNRFECALGERMETRNE